jgi:hypothetical protein
VRATKTCPIGTSDIPYIMRILSVTTRPSQRGGFKENAVKSTAAVVSDFGRAANNKIEKEDIQPPPPTLKLPQKAAVNTTTTSTTITTTVNRRVELGAVTPTTQVVAAIAPPPPLLPSKKIVLPPSHSETEPEQLTSPPPRPPSPPSPVVEPPAAATTTSTTAAAAAAAAETDPLLSPSTLLKKPPVFRVMSGKAAMMELKAANLQRDASAVTVGSVSERIKAFSKQSNKKSNDIDPSIFLKKGDPEAFQKKNAAIVQAAIKIQAVVRRIEAQKEYKIHQKFATSKTLSKQKKEAVVKMQRLARGHLARQKSQVLLDKLRAELRQKQVTAQQKQKTMAHEARVAEKNRLTLEQERATAESAQEEEADHNQQVMEDDQRRREEEEAAAIRIQALVRSAMTRVTVLEILEVLIAELDSPDVPRGAVGERIKAWKQKNRSRNDDDDDDVMLQQRDPTAFARKQAAKQQAALSIQGMVRSHQARKRVDQLAQQKIDRLRREQEKANAAAAAAAQQQQEEAEELAKQQKAKEEQERIAQEQAERARKDAEVNAQKREAAAIQIQSIVRSFQSRMRVLAMVDQMIAALLAQDEKEQEQRGTMVVETKEEIQEPQEEEEPHELEEVKEAEETPVVGSNKLLKNKGIDVFVGPLPWDVDVLPLWWLEQAPYKWKTDFEEESSEFRTWRFRQIELYSSGSSNSDDMQ